MRGERWEYTTLRLPRRTQRSDLREKLAIAATYGDWELRRHVIWPDGRREVTLRRRDTGLDPDAPVAPPSF